MNKLKITYGHEFISNRISDELILYDIWNYREIEEYILNEIEDNFKFNPGNNRDINTLSGGQRAITYLITLCFILKERKISALKLEMDNISQSLTPGNRKKIVSYLSQRGIDAA